jgi:hypothetical protein
MMKLVLCLIHLLTKKTGLASPDALEFLVLGDWGKGGNAGNILNTLSSDQLSLNKAYPEVSYARDDSYSVNAENKEGGGKDGGGKNKKQYTYQAAVARAMSKWVTQSNVTPSFVVAVGDNFYDDGVSSSTAASWNTLWKYVYLSNYSNLRIPWYPVLGNHGMLYVALSLYYYIISPVLCSRLWLWALRCSGSSGQVQVSILHL